MQRSFGSPSALSSLSLSSSVTIANDDERRNNNDDDDDVDGSTEKAAASDAKAQASAKRKSPPIRLGELIRIRAIDEADLRFL